MFKLDPKPSVWAPVAWDVPADISDDAFARGEHAQPSARVAIRVRFRLLTRREYEALVRRFIGLARKEQEAGATLDEAALVELAEEAKAITGDEFCREIVTDWKDVIDDQGRPIPFSPDALDRLLDVVGAQPAIVAAFFRAMNGGNAREEAARKNSLTPSENSPRTAG